MGNSPHQFNEKFVGKRLIRNLQNKDGKVILPFSTIIRVEHKKILDEHNIKLTDHDVTIIGPYGAISISDDERLVDEAVQHVKRLFHDIRIMKVIPLLEIKQQIVPVIHHVIEHMKVTEILSALRVRNDYTERHHFAVAVLSTLMGRWLKLSKTELLQLTTAAILHDVGKTQIPLEILEKPGKLTDEEYKIMISHTIKGYELIRNTVGTTHRQALGALQHHEKMNGQGYPFGISGDQIDLYGRIIAIADIYHAMASERAYRNASPFYEVLSQLEEHTYGTLDIVIVRLFIEQVMNHTVGCEVYLTDGRIGKIIHINSQHPTRPLVHAGEAFIDLNQVSGINIEQVIGYRVEQST